MNPPTVSIGLPVYNGEKYLRLAIESLLAQDYKDFELIISDNASTDRTKEICAEYAQKNSRVRYHRNSLNIGMVGNFVQVFKLSIGKYFMWAAHDDRWAPNYISKCVEALEKNPSAVLCGSHIIFLDQNGNEMEEEVWRKRIREHNLLNTQSMDLRERIRELTRKMNWYNSIYGVIRSDVLRKIQPLWTKEYGADVLILMKLLFHGETLVLPQPLFYYHLPDNVTKTQIRYYQELAGISIKNATYKRTYTDLALSLLQVIDESSVAEDLKVVMKKDLVENVSHHQTWRRLILTESFGSVSFSTDHADTLITTILKPKMSLLKIQKIQDTVFSPLLSKMHPSKRIRIKMRRFLDKYIFFRFRPWP